ncbi:MAG: hypothetical protein KGI54_16825 [Pseudomonadota bacterium]|nr:hypothetical protein [Pseudomonadota bacterium]
MEQSNIGPSREAALHAHIEVIQPPRNTAILPVSRRVGMHDRLVKSDKITIEEWQWVSRYCLDLERVQGAKPGKPEFESEHSDGGLQIYDRRAMAATFIRLSDARMSKKEREIVISACVQAHRVCDVAIVCGLLPGDDETMEAFSRRIDAAVKKRVVLAIGYGSGAKKRNSPG